MTKKLYQLALTFVSGLTIPNCRKLLEVCPDPEALFNSSEAELRQIFGDHDKIISQFLSKEPLRRAEQELELAQQHDIKVLFCTDPEYPQRLNRSECRDLPVILYMKGNCDLNARHIVSIVGSRRATEYGKECTRKLVEQMQADGLTIVSGLAYGIDTAAHTNAVTYGLPTVGVMGHGLDHVYPSQNQGLAKRMVEQQGALLTEYPWNTTTLPGNFPARNRIIAALSDATIVVEATEKGGALITATMASGYNRDVFAVPGRLDDLCSQGCNHLIVTNKASLIRNAGDLFYQMGWDARLAHPVQQELFPTLSPDESRVCKQLQECPELTMDEISSKSGLSLPKIAAALLHLELENVVKCLPGKKYKLM